MRKHKKLLTIVVALVFFCIVFSGFLLLLKNTDNKPKDTLPQKSSGQLVQEQGTSLSNRLTDGTYEYKKEDFSILINLGNNYLLAGSYEKAYTAVSKIPDTEIADRVKAKYELCMYIQSSAANQSKYSECRSQFNTVIKTRSKETGFAALLTSFESRYPATFTPVQKMTDQKESDS